MRARPPRVARTARRRWTAPAGCPSASSSPSACRTTTAATRRRTPEPALVGGGFLLRGSIDLVERRVDGAALRVTDHKTGKNRTTLATIIDGGARAAAGALRPGAGGDHRRVGGGRPPVLLHRRRQLQPSTRSPLDPVIRRAWPRGAGDHRPRRRARHPGAAPAPRRHRACDYCDFRPVCGPDERTGRCASRGCRPGS